MMELLENFNNSKIQVLGFEPSVNVAELAGKKI